MRRIHLMADKTDVGIFDIDETDVPLVVSYKGKTFALEAALDALSPPAVRIYRLANVVELDAPEESGEGPTLLEYVKQGYSFDSYPPKGFSAKPYTQPEKIQALTIENERKANTDKELKKEATSDWLVDQIKAAQTLQPVQLANLNSTVTSRIRAEKRDDLVKQWDNAYRARLEAIAK